MIIYLEQGNCFLSLLLLSLRPKLVFEALLNSSEELKPALDCLASSPAVGLVDGSSLTALLMEIEKPPLTAADVVVIFGVLTRRGCSGRDVAAAVMLIDPAETGSMAASLCSCLHRLESAMRADSKRGLNALTRIKKNIEMTGAKTKKTDIQSLKRSQAVVIETSR